MNKVLPFLFAVLFISCSSTEDNSSEDKIKEMEELVENYKKIPAFPFQFTYEDLHVEPVELSKEHKEQYFDLEEGVSVQALHYYLIGESYVLFTAWNVVPIPSNGQIHLQADMFDKYGEKIASVKPIPYQSAHMEYKSNPKFEIWENSLSFIIEEIYYVDEIVEGPVDGLPNQIEYRAFYAQNYETTIDGFNKLEETPFWMKIPRNFFSPFMIDYLRKDGVFDHVVNETENSFAVEDKLDKQYRTSFYQFEDGIIGISSSFEDERTEKIISTVSFIELKEQSIADKTDEILGEYKEQLQKNGCDCSELNSENGLIHVLTSTADKEDFPYVDFTDGKVNFYCFNAKQDENPVLMSLNYQNGQLAD
jgi:hypothetical protein